MRRDWFNVDQVPRSCLPAIGSELGTNKVWLLQIFNGIAGQMARIVLQRQLTPLDLWASTLPGNEYEIGGRSQLHDQTLSIFQEKKYVAVRAILSAGDRGHHICSLCSGPRQTPFLSPAVKISRTKSMGCQSCAVCLLHVDRQACTQDPGVS